MSRAASSPDTEVDAPTSSTPTRLTWALRKVVVVWAVILLVGCLIIRAAAGVNEVIDIDEFHFLHSAWMVGHGYLPYRDFWSNHSPLFIYGLKPLVAIYDENLRLFPVVRLLHLMINLGLFGLVALLAARERSWTAGLFAGLLLSVNLTVFLATVRLRHDSLTLICQLVALALLARGIRFGRLRDVLAAGVALGLALALSPKGLFGLSGLVIGCVVHHVSSAPGAERRWALMQVTRFIGALLVGSLGTLALVLVFLLPLEVWPLMVKRVFLESLLSPERFSPLTVYLLRYILAEPVVWVVMLGGFAIAARQWWVGPMRRDPADTLLLVAGLWFGMTYLFLMSSPYPQSALPFLAIGSIFSGRLLALGQARLSGATSNAKTVAWAACLTALVGWIAIGSALSFLQDHSPFRRMNANQMQMIQYVLSVTRPEDAVFDADAAYVFRPQASYYGSLMSTIRIQIQREELEFDIPERCERLACKVVITGSRVDRLPHKVQSWIRDNYIPSPALPRVLLHRSLAPEARGPGR